MKFSPFSHYQPHALFEGGIEGAVTSVAAVFSQLLNGEVAVGSNGFTIEADEMIDAKIVDISIIIHALAGEILTEVEAVGTNNLGKLGNGQVVLQVELCVYAMLL